MLLQNDTGGDNVGCARRYRVRRGIATIRSLRVIHE